MPVYDIAANMRFAQPYEAFARGRAMRDAMRRQKVEDERAAIAFAMEQKLAEQQMALRAAQESRRGQAEVRAQERHESESELARNRDRRADEELGIRRRESEARTEGIVIRQDLERLERDQRLRDQGLDYLESIQSSEDPVAEYQKMLERFDEQYGARPPGLPEEYDEDVVNEMLLAAAGENAQGAQQMVLLARRLRKTGDPDDVAMAEQIEGMLQGRQTAGTGAEREAGVLSEADAVLKAGEELPPEMEQAVKAALTSRAATAGGKRLIAKLYPEIASKFLPEEPSADPEQASIAAAGTFRDIGGTLSGVTMGTTGVRGAGGQLLGGLAGQFDEDRGDQIEEAITGKDSQLAEAQRLRQRVLIAQNLRAVIAEQGARISDSERKIAQSTIRTMETDASRKQIIGAGAELMRLQLMIHTRAAKEAGITPEYDLCNEEIRRNVWQIMRDAQISDELIIDILSSVMREQGIE